MNKKIKPNRYKPEPKAPSRLYEDLGTGIDICLKLILVVAGFSILSLAAIFTHDFVTQAECFNVSGIEVTGLNRSTREEILSLCDLNRERNIFDLNLSLAEKQIESHPWIQKAKIHRGLHSKLKISIQEFEPMAIARMGENANILMDIRGIPFKEYEKETDRAETLPVITGLGLKKIKEDYLFAGTLFDSVMDFLKTGLDVNTDHIDGNENTGITVQARNFFNPASTLEDKSVPIKLGFDNYKAKLKRAKKISEYFDKNLPEKTICAMDIFNIEKIFIKTKTNDAKHNNLKKGA